MAGRLEAVVSRLCWTPPRARWVANADYELTWGLTALFGLVAACCVANLYYTQPILNILAEDFGITDERASLVPTVVQAGYAGGLFFIVPIGDIVRRRPMVICLVIATSVVWLGCILTKSFSAFLGLSFVVGLLTISPQLMLPLALHYSPARHRTMMVTIVMSGLVFGVLAARLLSGVVAQFAGWRSVFWVSYALQLALLVPIFLMMPDFPVLRPDTSYPRVLLKIVQLPFQQPVLTQQALIAFLVTAMFTSFWTTLTFQMAGPPFELSTLVIGLFALVGMSAVLLSPLVSRFVMTRLHPSGTMILAHVMLLGAIATGTFVGTFSIAGLVIWACLGDLGLNVVVVSNRMALANVDPQAQNAVNSVYMVFTFCGQLFGTAVGNKLYADGGWVRSGSLSIGLVAFSLLLVLVRGPHETGWIGWGGGWELRTCKIDERQKMQQKLETQIDEEVDIQRPTAAIKTEFRQSASSTLVPQTPTSPVWNLEPEKVG